MFSRNSLFVLALVTSGIASPVAAENLQGFAKGTVVRSIDPPDSGIALLQSFYFKYSNSDHHLRSIQIGPNVPSVNQALIGYTDKNSDDEYFYNIDFQRYTGPIFQRSHGREVCVNTCTKTILTPAGRDNYVVVIRGYNIFFHGDDHHLDQLSIRENNGEVTVGFNDKNNDDTFLWDLHYAYIPRSRFSDISFRSGNAKGGEQVDIPSGAAVIRGFHFDFANKDHHIKDVGVVMNGNNRMTVFYGDKNQDDEFAWVVRYGILRSTPVNLEFPTLDPNSIPVLEDRVSGRL